MTQLYKCYETGEIFRAVSIKELYGIDLHTLRKGCETLTPIKTRHGDKLTFCYETIEGQADYNFQNFMKKE